jgi:TolB-like protein
MKNTLTLCSLIFSAVFIIICSSTTSAMNLEEGIKDLADQIASKIQKDAIPKGNKLKIAVMELSDINGNVNNAGKFLAEELIMPLFLTKKFIVIERNLLNKILKEHSLQLTGLIDATTVKKLGMVLGVDAICSGTMAQVGDGYKINLRLISTETGMIIAAASNKIPEKEFASMSSAAIQPDSHSRITSKGDAMPIEPGVYRVMVKVLNLRGEPNVSSAILEGLVYGDKVQVVEVTDITQTIENIAARWVKVKTRSGKQGYVFSGFLLID